MTIDKRMITNRDIIHISIFTSINLIYLIVFGFSIKIKLLRSKKRQFLVRKMALNTAHINGGVLIHAGEQ